MKAAEAQQIWLETLAHFGSAVERQWREMYNQERAFQFAAWLKTHQITEN